MSKQRTCKQCRSRKPAEEMLQTRQGWFDSTECIAKWAADKQQKAIEKRQKQAKKERKEKFYGNDRTYQLKMAQEAFNAFIRKRDEKEPCISCGRFHKGQYHAGHYRSVGAAPHLRFNQFNNNKQCSCCNNHKSGNSIEYRIRLVEKWGVRKVEEIEAENEPKKWTLEEIKAIRTYYRKLANAIEKERA